MPNRKDLSKLTLYHTSQVEIPVPDIHHGRKNADFGEGFYLTPNLDFTYRWAWENAVVNTYELALDRLLVHRFTRTMEWVEYIFHNRRAEDTLDADVVIGPVANDTIFDTLGIISSGYLSSEEALQLLMIGPEYTQVAIKTQKAADRLKWIDAEQTTDLKVYKDQLKREQDVYLEQLAAAMERMS